MRRILVSLLLLRVVMELFKPIKSKVCHPHKRY